MRSFIHDALFAIQYESGAIVDLKKSNTGIISGVIESTDPDTVPEITITHCKTPDGTFEPLMDKYAFASDYQQEPFVAGGYGYVNIDLRGCEQYAKFDISFKNKKTGATSTADWKTVLVRDSIPTSINIFG